MTTVRQILRWKLLYGAYVAPSAKTAPVSLPVSATRADLQSCRLSPGLGQLTRLKPAQLAKAINRFVLPVRRKRAHLPATMSPECAGYPAKIRPAQTEPRERTNSRDAPE